MALRETKEALEAIVASAPVAITTTDREHRISMWNPAAERMFGWTVAEVLNTLPPQIPPELEDETRALRVRALAGETIAAYETQRLRKDGTRIDVSLALTPIRHAGGEIVGAIGILVDISSQVAARRHLQRTVSRLEEVDSQRSTLLRRLVGAQEEERRRLAGDIHDDSVQALTALVLRLGLLHGTIDDKQQREFLVNAEEAARNAISRLRHLIFELRPPALERDGLAAALQILLDDLHESTGVEYTLDDRMTGEPPGELRSIIYRIAQEALANVRKHACAHAIGVSLENEDGGVLVRVDDDGIGLPPGATGQQESGHIGFSTMRERAETAGGWWRIASNPGRGTTIEFRVPCEDAS
jgi:PAS domain S-box-containing protein